MDERMFNKAHTLMFVVLLPSILSGISSTAITFHNSSFLDILTPQNFTNLSSFKRMTLAELPVFEKAG